MRKKIIGILSLTFVVCASFIASASLTVFASVNYSTNAVYPFTGYGTLIEITDIAYDNANKDIYILQRKFADKPAAIYKCKSDGTSEQLSVSLTDPKQIYYEGNSLYIYDSGSIKDLNSNAYDVEAAGISNILDFVVVGKKIYALTSNAISVFDTDTSSAQQVIGGLLQATTLTHSDGNLYFVEEMTNVPYSTVKKYSIALGTLTKINFQGMSAAKNIAANQRYIAISSAESLQIIDLASGENKAFMNISSSNPNSGGYIKEVQCITFTDENKMYIGDNLSKCVQGFMFDEITSQINYDEFYMGSFGSGDGQFYNPTDTFEQNGKKYILDSGNDRVQIIDDNNKIVKKDLRKAKNYRKIIADSSDRIYVANQNEIYNLSDDFVISDYVGISDLQLSFNSDIYFSSARKIYQIKDGKQTLILEANSNISSFAFDLKNENIYYAVQNKIVKHNIEKPQDNIEYALSDIVDMDIDFMSNLYLLDRNNTVHTLDENLDNHIPYEITTIKLKSRDTLPVTSIASIAIDKTSGEIMLCHTDEHLISKLSIDTLKATTEGDVPKLLPLTNILDGDNMQEGVKIGVIDGWPSTIIYPFHDMYKLSAVYPSENAYTEVTRLYGKSPSVIIIEQVDNYYYVLYENKVGFILKNKVRILEDGKSPYESGSILHTNTVIYKLPSSQKNAYNKSVFQCELLEKGTEVQLLDIVANYRDKNGFVWYKIKYGDKIGYVSRDNVTRKHSFSESQIRNGKIRAQISEGKVALFDTTSESGLSIADMKDGVSVKVLEILPGDWLYIQGEDVSGKLVTGYVKKQYVTYQVLTTSQIVGICMISATVILVIATLILVKIHKSKKRKSF